MYDWLITKLTVAFYGKQLQKEAAEKSEQLEEEIGTAVAARSARGNVAIQQGRIHDAQLPRAD